MVKETKKKMERKISIYLILVLSSLISPLLFFFTMVQEICSNWAFKNLQIDQLLFNLTISYFIMVEESFCNWPVRNHQINLFLSIQSHNPWFFAMVKSSFRPIRNFQKNLFLLNFMKTKRKMEFSLTFPVFFRLYNREKK